MTRIQILDRLTSKLRFEVDVSDELDTPAARLSAAIDCALEDDIDLTGTDLRGADLRKTQYNLDLTNADLSQADLTGLDLSWSSFDGAILDGASLRDVHIRKSSFNAASLRKANFHGALLERVTFSDADCSGASFEDSNFFDIQAQRTIFRDTIFKPHCFEGDFDGCDFAGAKFLTLAFYPSGDFRLDEVCFDPVYETDFLAYLSGFPPVVIAKFRNWLASDATPVTSKTLLGLSKRLYQLSGQRNVPQAEMRDVHPDDQTLQTPAAQWFEIFRLGAAERTSASEFARTRMLEWISNYAVRNDIPVPTSD